MWTNDEKHFPRQETTDEFGTLILEEYWIIEKDYIIIDIAGSVRENDFVVDAILPDDNPLMPEPIIMTENDTRLWLDMVLDMPMDLLIQFYTMD